jgi:ATP-dependent DNA helicase RecG
MVYATIRQHGDVVTTEKATERYEGVDGPVNGLVTSLKGVLKDIYLIVLNNPGIKIAQVAELRGKSESTVWKQLNELTKKGIIEYRGSDKTGGYYAK